MTEELVIGLDCGTSSVKAVAWNARGEAAGEARAALRTESPMPLRREQDADGWLDASRAALRDALRDAERKRGAGTFAVRALCVSHQRETFVPVDGSGRPLRKALLWMDERAGPLLDGLRARSGGDSFRRITGKALSANLSLCKIEWLRANEPELFRKTAAFLDVQAFVVRALTGRAATGWGSADPTGLFDMERREWSASLLSETGLDRSRLPEALEPGSIAGTLTREAAGACGLPEGLPVVIGLGDGQSAGLGCGIAGPGESYLSLGTSIVSGTFSDHYVSGTEFRTSFGGIKGSYFLETVISGGAYTVEWFMEKFGPFGAGAEKALEREAAALPPGSEGLLLVPYWNGAMNPYWDSSARGIVVGWSGIHGRAHLYRAILEGAALEQRLHTEGVAGAVKAPILRYVASGGGAASELWLRIIANATGRQVVRSKSREAAALGAGMLAAAAIGMHPDAAAAAAAMSAREDRAIEPDGADRERYEALYPVYRRLYPALADSLRELAGARPGAPSA